MEITVRPTASNMKCIVLNCENHDTQGAFKGTLCVPCFNYITKGEGKHSQMYCNSIAQQVANRINPPEAPLAFEGTLRYNQNTYQAETYIGGKWVPIQKV